MQYPKQISDLLNNRFFQHIAFWGFFITFETIHLYDKFADENILNGFYITLSRFSAAIILVYINLFIYIPKILEKNKTFTYVILLIITYFAVVYSVYGMHIIFWEEFLAMLNSFPLRPRYLGSLFGVTFLLTILSSLIHFAKRWVKLKDVEIELNGEKSQRLEAELKTLKGQVNPHFLFNSLNNIYSLSLDKSDLAPDMILKLSALMSYMIYDARVETIELNKELEFVKNHVELEGIRVKNKVKIDYNSDSDVEEYEIAPLLFTPFIENAFKYVSKQSINESFIKIDLKVVNGELHFICENSAEPESTTFDHNNHGIGIENVKKRLQLIYPNNHDLLIEHSVSTFIVNLKIKF